MMKFRARVVAVIIHRRELYRGRINRNWLGEQESNMMTVASVSILYITSDRKPTQTCLNENENSLVHIFESRHSFLCCFSDPLSLTGSSSGRLHICGGVDGSWTPELHHPRGWKISIKREPLHMYFNQKVVNGSSDSI